MDLQVTPEAAPMKSGLYGVTGNVGGDEGRITTWGLQVTPGAAAGNSGLSEAKFDTDFAWRTSDGGAGCGLPLRGQRQPPEAAGGLASQHREGSSGGRDQAHLRSLAVPLGGPDVERQRPLHQGGVQFPGLCTGMAGKGDAM